MQLIGWFPGSWNEGFKHLGCWSLASHYVALQVFRESAASRYKLQRLISTREEDQAGGRPPSSLADLEDYADGTAGQVQALQVDTAQSNVLPPLYYTKLAGANWKAGLQSNLGDTSLFTLRSASMGQSLMPICGCGGPSELNFVSSNCESRPLNNMDMGCSTYHKIQVPEKLYAVIPLSLPLEVCPRQQLQMPISELSKKATRAKVCDASQYKLEFNCSEFGFIVDRLDAMNKSLTQPSHIKPNIYMRMWAGDKYVAHAFKREYETQKQSISMLMLAQWRLFSYLRVVVGCSWMQWGARIAAQIMRPPTWARHVAWSTSSEAQPTTLKGATHALDAPAHLYADLRPCNRWETVFHMEETKCLTYVDPRYSFCQNLPFYKSWFPA